MAHLFGNLDIIREGAPNQSIEIESSAAASNRIRSTSPEGNKKFLYIDATQDETGSPSGETSIIFRNGPESAPIAVLRIGEDSNVTILNGPLVQNVGTPFPDTDLTPSVNDGNVFLCGAQASPIQITDLDDGAQGQEITIIAVDSDTEFLNTGNMNMPGTWSPTVGQAQKFTFVGSTWYQTINI